MEIKTLRYFVVVAEERNITHAAKILMMSQPPLSNQIKHLEEELHTTLFHRGKKELTLTEEGRYLYRKAKDILALSDKTVEDITSIGKGLSGTISLGVVSSFPSALTSLHIAEFRAQNPGVAFNLSFDDSDSLIDKMRLGLITVAIIAAPYDETELNCVPLLEKKLYACMKADHPLVKERILTSRDIGENPLIVPSRKKWQGIIRRWFDKNHLEARFACETNSYGAAIALVNKGVGIALVPCPDENVDPKVCFVPLEGKDKKLSFLFVWRKGHPLPTSEESFIDYVKNTYAPAE